MQMKQGKLCKLNFENEKKMATKNKSFRFCVY